MCTYVYNIMSRVNSQDMCICQDSLRSDITLPITNPSLEGQPGTRYDMRLLLAQQGGSPWGLKNVMQIISKWVGVHKPSPPPSRSQKCLKRSVLSSATQYLSTEHNQARGGGGGKRHNIYIFFFSSGNYNSVPACICLESGCM